MGLIEGVRATTAVIIEWSMGVAVPSRGNAITTIAIDQRASTGDSRDADLWDIVEFDVVEFTDGRPFKAAMSIIWSGAAPRN